MNKFYRWCYSFWVEWGFASNRKSIKAAAKAYPSTAMAVLTNPNYLDGGRVSLEDIADILEGFEAGKKGKNRAKLEKLFDRHCKKRPGFPEVFSGKLKSASEGVVRRFSAISLIWKTIASFFKLSPSSDNADGSTAKRVSDDGTSNRLSSKEASSQVATAGLENVEVSAAGVDLAVHHEDDAGTASRLSDGDEVLNVVQRAATVHHYTSTEAVLSGSLQAELAFGEKDSSAPAHALAGAESISDVPNDLADYKTPDSSDAAPVEAGEIKTPRHVSAITSEESKGAPQPSDGTDEAKAALLNAGLVKAEVETKRTDKVDYNPTARTEETSSPQLEASGQTIQVNAAKTNTVRKSPVALKKNTFFGDMRAKRNMSEARKDMMKTLRSMMQDEKVARNTAQNAEAWALFYDEQKNPAKKFYALYAVFKAQLNKKELSKEEFDARIEALSSDLSACDKAFLPLDMLEAAFEFSNTYATKIAGKEALEKKNHAKGQDNSKGKIERLFGRLGRKNPAADKNAAIEPFKPSEKLEELLRRVEVIDRFNDKLLAHYLRTLRPMDAAGRERCMKLLESARLIKVNNKGMRDYSVLLIRLKELLDDEKAPFSQEAVAAIACLDSNLAQWIICERFNVKEHAFSIALILSDYSERDPKGPLVSYVNKHGGILVKADKGVVKLLDLCRDNSQAEVILNASIFSGILNAQKAAQPALISATSVSSPQVLVATPVAPASEVSQAYVASAALPPAAPPPPPPPSMDGLKKLKPSVTGSKKPGATGGLLGELQVGVTLRQVPATEDKPADTMSELLKAIQGGTQLKKTDGPQAASTKTFAPTNALAAALQKRFQQDGDYHRDADDIDARVAASRKENAAARPKDPQDQLAAALAANILARGKNMNPDAFSGNDSDSDLEAADDAGWDLSVSL